jgi:predicted AAA+ superfamily ATPase
MIKREHYIEKIREFYDSEQIKFITGIKNSGKSTLLAQIMSEIKEKSDNIICLNFGDKRVSANIKTSDALIKYIESKQKNGKCYLFFDEMQALNGWKTACAELQEKGHSLFVIGSDHDFLTEDLTEEFGGKYVSFRVRPFVYKEILEYAQALRKDVSVNDYLIWGGFPKRFELDGDEPQRRYLDELDDTMVNELIRRYKIRREELFKSLVDFVLRSNSSIFSEKAIYDHVTKEQGSCSINTVMKYLDYLEEAYLIESVKQFSSKVDRELVFYTKLYDADVALNSIRCIDDDFDISRNLENAVYNELIYRDYDVSAYDNGGKKIDLLARKDGEEYFIQTVYGGEKSESELFDSFSGLGVAVKKIVITYGGADMSVNGAACVSFEDLLLMNSLDDLTLETYTENFEESEKAHAKTVKPRKKTKAEKTEKKPDAIEEKKPEKKKVPFYQIF